MNQVAVVIGGGQTLGAFLCHGLAAEGYRVAVVDIQSDKAANVAQEINAEYGESMAYGFGADATSEQSVLALSRGVDEIFGRVDLLVYSAGIAKAAFISDFQLGDFDRSLQVNLVAFDDPRRDSGAHYSDQLEIRQSGQQTQLWLQRSEIWWRRADSITGAGSGGVRHYGAFTDAR